MKIYIAAPLFNESEKRRNIELRDFLKSLGHETFLPQQDGEIAFDSINNSSEAEKVRDRVFQSDLNEIKKCDAILCVIDGRVPDEGMCIELGIAFALGKKCIGFKTDQRTLDRYGDNLMIEGCLETIAHSHQELKGVLS